jgi:hypothetical protein
MGTNLFSARYAAKIAEVSPALLDGWLKNGRFGTEHFAKDTKTQEKTFYFSQTDLNRLTEFAATEARKSRLSNISAFDLAAD